MSTRTIDVYTASGVKRIGNIPENAKITYGGLRPDQPGTKTNTLRIYTGANGQNQLAVFRDVIWFFDLGLTVEDLGSGKDDFL